MDASILNYSVNDNVAKFLSQTKKLYINGDWVDSKSGKTFDVEDPATGKKIATCSAGNSKDIDAAVKAARTNETDARKSVAINSAGSKFIFP